MTQLLTMTTTHKFPPQVYEESQNVPTAWSNQEEEVETPAPTLASRLTNYHKHVDPSQYGEDHAYEPAAVTYEPTVNEHGQQQGGGSLAVDHDTTTTPPAEENGWKPANSPFRPYVEIDRTRGPAVASVETVEITEPRDYSESDIIYDEDKVGFADDTVRDNYAVPVSVQLNLPAAESTTEEDLSTTIVPSTSTSDYQRETTSFRDTSTTVYTTPARDGNL